MTFRNIRPVHLLWQETLAVGMLDGIISGITQVLSLAGVYQETPVEYVGKRRQPNWRNPDGTLVAYQSLDWHIELARQNSKVEGHLNSTVFLNSLRAEPTHQTRYELVVVNEPLHWSDDSLRKVIGIAQEGQGTVITLYHDLQLFEKNIWLSDEENKKRRSRFLLNTQMNTVHEFGHLFGLFPGTDARDPTYEEIKKVHCLNECVMSLDDQLYEKIKDNHFCPACLEKLQQYFIAP